MDNGFLAEPFCHNDIPDHARANPTSIIKIAHSRWSFPGDRHRCISPPYDVRGLHSYRPSRLTIMHCSTVAIETSRTASWGVETLHEAASVLPPKALSDLCGRGGTRVCPR